MEFWVTLIKTLEEPKGKALESLKANCTYVDKNFWIMEGEVDVLRDDGVVLEEVAEGAVGSLGGLSKKKLKEICWDDLGYKV